MKLRLCDFNYFVEVPVFVVPRYLINAPKIKSSSSQLAWDVFHLQWLCIVNATWQDIVSN